MKKRFLWGLLALCVLTPLSTIKSADGWGEGHKVSSDEWISKVGCEQTLKKSNCDYTGPSLALRLGYKYKFADEFWAGSNDRRMKNFCADFKEPLESGNYNKGDNPEFDRTSQLSDSGYRVRANDKSLIVLEADRYYKILAVPSVRSRDNLWIKYVIEYANDEKATTRYHHTECFPYEISRCGDGKVDKDRFMKEEDDPGEECDPAAPGWDKTTCDPVTCKKLPVCNSEYNGRELISLTEGNHLCKEGTVSNFKYDEATRTWTWECEAAGTGVECSAKKKYDGTRVVEKTLVSESKYITHTGQELVWEIKVTAKNGDVKDMRIKDELPPVLDYVSYTHTLPSGVTIASDQPTFSDNRKNVYWQTRGTLKSGESIVLRVVTKANAMPKTEENNVACASPEGEEDKCDDKPVKTEGKLEIEKTLTGKVTVQKTGEILTWNVKVSALSGDVDGFKIQDIVPLALQYVDYSIASNTDNLTVKDPTGPVKTATGNVYTWNVSGVLQSGHSLLLTVRTKIVLMPKAEDDYRNVACVIKEDNKDCDDDKPGNPDLRIKKYILDGNNEVKTKNVKIGDEITYKVYFGNSGDAEATITSIKDFLPKNVKYKSSEIHIERNSSHSSGTQVGNEEFKGYKIVDGVYIDIYGGLTLQPNDRGYIEIKAEVLSDNKDNRTNFACIYLNNEVVDCDDATHTFTEETMSCIPTLSPSTFSDVCSSDTSSFSTTVTCKSSRESDIEILCDGSVVKTGHASQLTGTCSATTNNIDHKAQCKINGSLTGTDGKSCEASFRRNTKSCGGGSSCFVAGTMVRMCDGTNKEIEKVEIGDEVRAENGCNEVKGYDRPLLGDRNLWSINGGEYFVSDEHPFKTTDGWKAIDSTMAQAEILNAIANKWLVSDDSTEELINITQLEEGNTLITSNGTTKITSLRSKKSDPNTQLYNFMLSGDNTYYANGYLVHNKGGGGSTSPYCDKLEPKGNNLVCTASKDAYFRIDCDGKLIGDLDGQDEKVSSIKYSDYKNCKIVTCYVSATKSNGRNGSKCVRENEMEESPSIPQGCFNVNAGNFSIEEGEIMPFYWNLKNLDDDAFGGKIRKDNYTEIKDENYDAVNVYSSHQDGVECNEDGKIATNSMVCTFNIYDGSGYHKGVQNGVDKNNPLYTIEGPCLASSSVIENNDLIKARYGAMKETYCKDSNSTDCVFYYGDGSSSAVLPTAVYYIENFGSGASVGVDAGSFKNNKLKFIDTWDLAGKPENKKSYGEYKIELSSVKYLQCEDGTWQKKEPVLDPPCQNDFVLTNSYTVQKTPSGNLTASMKELQKYYNYSGTMTFDTLLNAIQSTTYKPNDNVNGAMDKFINKYKKLAVKVDITNSKLLEGGATVSKVPGKSIYFVDGGITINGSKKNIDTPFTIVQTNGNATINGNVGHNMMLLTNGNIIFQGDCTSDQTVKGIFYAKGNLSRLGVDEKNTNIKSKTWCTYGGLHVKGVLIGNNFNNLMKASRSNLNMRFKAEGDEDKIKDQRRKYLMNGASVVIEYSPSIFTKSTMPPGAEDFTTALSIYKN